MGHPFNVGLQNKIRRKLDFGWRKQASILGLPFDIVRNEIVVVTNEPYMHIQWSKRRDQEALTEPFFYKFTGSRTLLKIGDHLVGKQPATTYGQSDLTERYTVVSLRDFSSTICIRTNWLVRAYRPTQKSQVGNVNPTYNWTTPEVDPQLVRNKSTNVWEWREQSLIDSNYSINVWSGITSGYSADYKIEAKTPLTVRPNEFVLTLGRLNGIEFREGDVLVDENNNRYRVDMPHTQKDSAFISQLYTSRVIA